MRSRILPRRSGEPSDPRLNQTACRDLTEQAPHDIQPIRSVTLLARHSQAYSLRCARIDTSGLVRPEASNPRPSLSQHLACCTGFVIVIRRSSFLRRSLRYLLRRPMPSLALKVINITPGPLLPSSLSSFSSSTPCMRSAVSLYATTRVSVIVARITLGSSWLLGRWHLTSHVVEPGTSHPKVIPPYLASRDSSPLSYIRLPAHADNATCVAD